MPYTIALTGGIGSGKSTISNIFARLNINIIDSDVIAHEMVKPGSHVLRIINERYGCSILTKNGTLFRSRLREIIFQNDKERYWLNNLLHPLIDIKTKELKKTVKSPYVIWVAPLLIENKLQHCADRILVVNVNKSIQLKRVQVRDNVPISQLEQIIAIQATQQQRMVFADDIIDNIGTIENTFLQVIKLHNFYLKLAKMKQG
ncbi:dephospho-CoA kinase [Candidatus Pantoea edessiphila]|uniref:Dephospho-CoA kinase n=1 Tax=Candidatus Pantoea edessiphila TaxID=2044610 RepID=A0A2P5SY99_9GAMM|nr:dephospho-CoA kinase [Candidatus Pantoea edessiphila]MBK4775584.1 dephospho-CoA kinase [Pantoea sp. Edef]PPI87317.1 dephospho-CoA kinase [Candidatus Pantoea edessiphila]